MAKMKRITITLDQLLSIFQEDTTTWVSESPIKDESTTVVTLFDRERQILVFLVENRDFPDVPIGTPIPETTEFSIHIAPNTSPHEW